MQQREGGLVNIGIFLALFHVVAGQHRAKIIFDPTMLQRGSYHFGRGRRRHAHSHALFSQVLQQLPHAVLKTDLVAVKITEVFIHHVENFLWINRRGEILAQHGNPHRNGGGVHFFKHIPIYLISCGMKITAKYLIQALVPNKHGIGKCSVQIKNRACDLVHLCLQKFFSMTILYHIFLPNARPLMLSRAHIFHADLI